MAEKVTFDGETKIIEVLPGVTSIDVEKDLYSAWKRWVLNDNAHWLLAFDSSGGDPLDLSNSQFSPKFFFLKNGWRVKVATGEVVSIKYNLFTFNEDGIIYNLSNSSSVIPEISKVPVVGGSTDLTEVNSKLDALQASILLIKSATDKLSFEGSEVLSKLSDTSKQAIRDALALQLSTNVVISNGSVDRIIDRIDRNTQM